MKNTTFYLAQKPGARLAVACKKDATTGELIHEFSHTGNVLGVAFSPDGQRLAACGGYKAKGEIKIWDRTLWDKQADQ